MIPPRYSTFINIPSLGTCDNPLGGNAGVCNEFHCMGTYLGDSLKHHYTMCMVSALAPTVYNSIRLSTYATSLSVVTADVLPLCHLNGWSANPSVNTSTSVNICATDRQMLPSCLVSTGICITVEISSCLHILSQVTNIQSKPFLTHCPSCTLYTAHNLGRIFKCIRLLVHHI